MNFISEIFGVIFDWINGFTHNYGLSIILFTILFRLLLLPFDIRSRVGQRDYTEKMKKIQPEIDMLNKAYKNNPEKVQQEMMAIRKREGIGLMPKGCGTMLITYPILIAFFAVFRNLAAEHMTELALLTDETQIKEWFDTNGFLWVKNIWQPDVYFNFSEIWGLRVLPILKGINGNIIPETAQKVQEMMQSAFKGGFLADFADKFDMSSIEAFSQDVFNKLASARDYVADKGGNGFYILPLLAGAVQVLSLKVSGTQQTAQTNDPTQAQSAKMGTFMKVFFPILFVYFCLVSSTALAIYWITSSLCMILVNLIINKVLDARDKKKKALEAEGE